MKSLIFSNLNLVFKKKLNRYICAIFTVLLIFTISFLNVKIDKHHISSSEHLFFLQQQIYLVFFTFFSSILFPIICFFFFIPREYPTSYQSDLPSTKIKLYVSWLAVFWLFLLFMGIIFVAILLVKLGFLSNQELVFNNVIHLIFWVLGILFFSFFSFQVYYLCLYSFKSKYLLLFFQVASIFLIRLDYFFWLPMNWPFIFIDSIYNTYGKLIFFHEHSIKSLIFLFVGVVVAVNVAVKKLTNTCNKF